MYSLGGLYVRCAFLLPLIKDIIWKINPNTVTVFEQAGRMPTVKTQAGRSVEINKNDGHGWSDDTIRWIDASPLPYTVYLKDGFVSRKREWFLRRIRQLWTDMTTVISVITTAVFTKHHHDQDTHALSGNRWDDQAAWFYCDVNASY